jgi:gamma-glutamylcyclotransferase (GGCT)/AIG2-like uncharacterized protein YtfP
VHAGAVDVRPVGRQEDVALFFFYGTLLRGEPNWLALDLEGRARFVAADAVAGTLHDFGGYPGAYLGGDGLILGELFEIAEPDLVATLDQLEDYRPDDPAGSEYLRVEVVTRAGRRAWIYTHQLAAPGAPIPDGDWRALRIGQAAGQE